MQASQRGVKMLLNHFVKGRLYNRDLKDNEVFETIGGGHIKITRNPGSNATSVNNAKIIESEVFVYNLGTMFYIDDILYSHLLREYVIKHKSRTNYAGGNNGRSSTLGTPTDVEIVPNEFDHEQSGANGGGGGGGDYSIHDEDFDDEIITPKALPVQFYELPK